MLILTAQLQHISQPVSQITLLQFHILQITHTFVQCYIKHLLLLFESATFYDWGEVWVRWSVMVKCNIQ